MASRAPLANRVRHPIASSKREREIAIRSYGSPVCVGVRASFSAPAEDALHLAGAAQIVTTTNAIDVIPLLVPSIREFVAIG
jgi:hypothetical protein